MASKHQPEMQALSFFTILHFFHTFQNIAIHKRMVASKARNGLKQYMKAKPTKYSIYITCIFYCKEPQLFIFYIS